MPERERALLDGEPVTILSGKAGKRGKCLIRTAHGFEKEVAAKDLEKIDADDPLASFTYAETD